MVEQQGNNNYANLNGSLTFTDDSTIIHLNSSRLQVLNDRWQFTDDNQITLVNNEVHFSDFQLYHQPPNGQRQSLSVVGAVSPDPNKQLTLRIDHFQIDNLNPILKEKYQGEVNGFTDLRSLVRNKQDNTSNLMLESEVSVRKFAINGFEVGNIISLVDWNQAQQLLEVDMVLNRKEQSVVTLKGTYDPSEAEEQLALRAKLRDAHINVIEPFVDDFFTDIEGLASGDFRVSGRLDAPVTRGNGNITDGKTEG